MLEVAGLGAAIDAPPVDLSLQPGATLTLFGNQPAALSRLLDVLAGFLPSLGGTITVSGENVTSRAPAERRMRIVSPRDPLFRIWTFGTTSPSVCAPADRAEPKPVRRPDG